MPLKTKLDEIISVLPGLKSPTVIPLADSEWCSVHTVLDEKRFWEIIGKPERPWSSGHIGYSDRENDIVKNCQPTDRKHEKIQISIT